jgi:hypothetical protein
MVMTSEDLLNRSPTELDALYRQAPIGPIPDGVAEGHVLFIADTPVNRLITWYVRALAWQGKVFFRDQGYLLNMVSALRLRLVKATLSRGKSWFCPGEEAIILDYSKTSFLAQKIRDEIREVSPGLFIGQAYWDDHRVLSFSLQFPT